MIKQGVFVLGVMYGLFILVAAGVSLWTGSWEPIIGTLIALVLALVCIALVIGLSELAERWWGDD